MCQNKTDYLQQIINFNSNKDIIALREKYKEPTFFEILSKQRSETTYSSFLKWMFQLSSVDSNTVSPILLLLDVLVNKCEGKINNDIKKHIVTRNFKINSIKVETEKSVSALASELGINEENLSYNKISDNKLTNDDIKKIKARCRDKIDIYISCDIELDGKSQNLQIIIENKIDSNEGRGKSNTKTGVDVYDNASQTVRYHLATAVNKESTIQSYVYLAPEGTKDPDCKEYIRINYQDIVDGVVIPMLASTTLSSKERFFLEELKTELTFPSLESRCARNSIAVSKETSTLYSDLWKDFKQLIIDAAIVAMESAIYFIGDKYYTTEPKTEAYVLKCLSTNYNDTSNQNWVGEKYTNTVQYDDGKTIGYDQKKKKDIKQFLQKKGVASGKVDFIDDDKELLNIFWNNNQRFLLAIMNANRDRDGDDIVKKLIDDSTKHSRKKYRVYYDNECLNDTWLGGKSSNNAETAWLIIKAWVEKIKEKKVNLDYIRENFKPENCNPYYKNGKWLKHLFYKFEDDGKYKADGDDNNGVVIQAGGWDFYERKKENDNKFLLETNDGKVIMLKMWRKDGLDKLINYVEKEPHFKEKLTIQEDK